MSRLNEQEHNLYEACEDYESYTCGYTACTNCEMYKKTGEHTGFCTVNYILNALIHKTESEV